MVEARHHQAAAVARHHAWVSSRCSASRIGVRETPKRSASSDSTSRSPGRKLALVDRLEHEVVGVLLAVCGDSRLPADWRPAPRSRARDERPPRAPRRVWPINRRRCRGRRRRCRPGRAAVEPRPCRAPSSPMSRPGSSTSTTRSIRPAIRLFDQIERRMTDYVMRDARGRRRRRRTRCARATGSTHGTTLAGLMREHGVDPEPYLAEVHDIDLTAVAPAPELARGDRPAARAQDRLHQRLARARAAGDAALRARRLLRRALRLRGRRLRAEARGGGLRRRLRARRAARRRGRRCSRTTPATSRCRTGSGCGPCWSGRRPTHPHVHHRDRGPAGLPRAARLI